MKISIVDLLATAFILCCFVGVGIIYYYQNWIGGIVLIIIGIVNFIQAYRIGKGRFQKKG